MSKRRLNLKNKRFGRLVAIKIFKIKKGIIYWLCKCDCGKEIKRETSSLTRTLHSLKRCSEKCILDFGSASFNHLYKNYKDRAKFRNKTFNLTKKEFKVLTKQNCIYCGYPPKNRFGFKRSYRFYYYNGIDRKNNKIGYEFKNCVPCCKKCNFMKHTLSKREFLDHVEKIYNFSN